MSKEEYLKGEEKEKALEKVRLFLGFRLTDEEIVDELLCYNIHISERTLRRYKQEIKENSGHNAAEVFKKHVIKNLIDDILSYEAVQKESWQVYNKTINQNEQIRALALVRNVTTDKIKLLKNIPYRFRNLNINSEKIDDLQKSAKELKEEIKQLYKN